MSSPEQDGAAVERAKPRRRAAAVFVAPGILAEDVHRVAVCRGTLYSTSSGRRDGQRGRLGELSGTARKVGGRLGDLARAASES